MPSQASYMPFFTRDFLSSSTVLSMDSAAVGIYILLLCHNWEDGYIPVEPRVLQRLCHAETSDWKTFLPFLDRCFPVVEGSEYRSNPRVDFERAKAMDKIDLRRKAGTKGAESRWQTHSKRIANASDCYSKGNAIAMRNQWHTDTYTDSDTNTDRDSDKKSLFIDRWNEFFDLYPKRAGDLSKSKGMKAFQSACKTTDPETIINGVKRYKAFCDATGKTGTEYVKQIPSWINAKGWDEAWDVPSQTNSPSRQQKGQFDGHAAFNRYMNDLRGGTQ